MITRVSAVSATVLLGVALTLGLAAPLQAQMGIPASGGTGESMLSEHQMKSMEGGSGWEIGSTDNRIGVTLDPNAGPWKKILQGPNGGGFAADDTGYTAPNSYQIKEHLVIAGNVPWTDWHERIVTAGWDFGGAFMSINNGQVPPGLDIVRYAQEWDKHGGAFMFTFDALQPGTTVDIQKWINWTGDPNRIGNLFFGTVTIEQYPTPEPSTLALLASGLIGLAVYAWRRRKHR